METKILINTEDKIIAIPDENNSDLYHLYDYDYCLLVSNVISGNLSEDKFRKYKFDGPQVYFPVEELDKIVDSLRNFSINEPHSHMTLKETKNVIETQVHTLGNYISIIRNNVESQR